MYMTYQFQHMLKMNLGFVYVCKIGYICFCITIICLINVDKIDRDGDLFLKIKNPILDFNRKMENQ